MAGLRTLLGVTMASGKPCYLPEEADAGDTSLRNAWGKRRGPLATTGHSQCRDRIPGGGACRATWNCRAQRRANFVDAVIARLDDWGLSGTTLHEEWSAIQNADADEQEFCHAAARLGTDPYAVDEQLEAAILDVAGTIRAELLDDFLSLAAVDELVSQATALATASEAIASDGDSIDALESVRKRAPPYQIGANPWETGYRFATELRAA